MYIRAHLKVDKDEIATPDKSKQRNCLKDIASDVTQCDDVDWCHLYESI